MLLGLLVPFAGSPAFAQTKGATASADVATYMKVNAPSSKLPLKFVDPKVVLDESDKWSRPFREIFNPSR